LALSYLSCVLSEEEYLTQRFKQDPGTGRTTRAAINNAKMFCQDVFKRELIVVMRDIREEVLKNEKLDVALMFLQKFIDWSSEDHLNVFYPKTIDSHLHPVYARDILTIRGYVSQMRLYLKKVCGIPISSEDVKDYKLSYPPQIEKEEAAPITLDEFRLICDNQSNFRRMMLYRIKKDCSARIGAMVQLKKKNFDTTVRPISVTFPKSIMKKKNGVAYTNVKFVTKEDEASLLKLLAPLNNEDLVFGTTSNKALAINNEEKAWKRLMIKLGLDEKYPHNGRLKRSIHSIKAFTFTAAVDAVNETYAHAYGDHSMYTKTYLRWSTQKKIEKFKKLEKSISIYSD
jgi:integrase